MNIHIPSKGRALTQKTSSLLSKRNVKHTIWIEPQDEEEYRKHLSQFATVRVLDKNDQGIAYVRQCILEEHRHQQQPYWIIDDDINKIVKLYLKDDKYHRNDKTTPVDEVLKEMETVFRSEEVCYGAPGHLSTVGFHGGKLNYLKQSYCVVWIDPRRLPASVNYDTKYKHIEDVIFVMSAILAGGKCLHHECFAYNAPPPGTAVGGLGMYSSNMEQWDQQNKLLTDFLDNAINQAPETYKSGNLYNIICKSEKRTVKHYWRSIHALARCMNPHIKDWDAEQLQKRRLIKAAQLNNQHDE